MSTPDSVHPAVLLPVLPRLSLAPSRPRAGISQAIASLPPALVATAGLVLIQTVAFFGSRLLAVSLRYDFYVDSTPTATALGALSFLSIVLVSTAIVLGHAALRASLGSSVWLRQAAAIVTGLAYLHLILWATRVIAAAFAIASGGSSGLFLPNVFWWG
jgi:H+/Cl- antiporter ClcA